MAAPATAPAPPGEVPEEGLPVVEVPPEPPTIKQRSKLCCGFYWPAFCTVFFPILFLPVPIIWNRKDAKCGYVLLIMGSYWITECVPLAITSLIPVVLFPTLGILDTSKTTKCYMNDTIMVFFGGLAFSIAIEYSNLHMRIALGVMRIVGCSHRRLLGGLCATTMFISMWITNTAATAMMVPIITAVLTELEKEGLGKMYNIDEPDPEKPEIEPEMHPTKVTKAYFFAAAYCSSLGGTGTLVGTGTNMTFKGIFEETFPKGPGIGFMPWTAFSLPQMLISTTLTYIYLMIVFLGVFRPNSSAAREATIGDEGVQIANRIIQEKYKDLGPWHWHESTVGLLFLTCIFMFVFRKPGFVTGWSEILSTLKIGDSVPIICAVILMFLIPKKLDFVYGCSKDYSKRPTASSEGLITWKVLQAKMPWGLLLLLGGGFAISKASNCSGLSLLIGQTLGALKAWNSPLAILFFVCFFASTLTEFTSNVGIANILLPVIAQMAIALEMNPMYLMVPVTICCSYSFRLPVGTPPNAIIAGSGHIKTKEMIIAGTGPAIWGFMMVVITFPTWGPVIYGDMSFVPDWAQSTKGNKSLEADC